MSRPTACTVAPARCWGGKQDDGLSLGEWLRLPVAACGGLFGVVHSSGVVGVDEKYVLVPKNDKPEGDMKRWMYVYFAVDCTTYDLLHIQFYPYNTKHSARAFLLALPGKGYHPRVVVTDMRVDYREVVAQVFPQAVHHECIFHALQQVREYAQEAYGTNYAQTHPEVGGERSTASSTPVPNGQLSGVTRRCWPNGRPSWPKAQRQPPSLTSWNAIGPTWSTASRAG